MTGPIHQIQAGIDAVKEQTYAAGLLGQGLLEHQRMLEGLLEELSGSDAADNSMDIVERVQEELQELHAERDRLFHEISHALGLNARPVTASLRSSRSFGFPHSPSFSTIEELERLRSGKSEAEHAAEALRARIADLEKKHDAFKQESWDQYVQQQRMEEQLATRTTAQNKADTERTRLNTELAKVREALDAQRARAEETEATLRKLQKQRDTEDATTRRERAGFHRNISDLQGQLKRLQEVERPSVPPALNAHIPEESDGAPEDTLLRERLALNEADLSQDDVVRLAPANAETDELRAKLSVAIKRLGRDTQQQRKLREQVAELRRMLSRAGVAAPPEDDDDDESDEEAWETEARSAPVPRRRPLARAPPKRVVSRETPAVASEWVDEAMGDDSVIVKDPSIDASMATLLSGAEAMRPSSSGVVNTGALGAELDAVGYAPSPDMVDVNVMTDVDPVEQARAEHETAMAELKEKHAAAMAALQQSADTRAKEHDSAVAALCKNCLLYTSPSPRDRG